MLKDVEERLDLSSLLNLLPSGSNILGELTKGTSLENVMKILELLNNLHKLQGDIKAIPEDIMKAINQTIGLIGGSVSNLTNIITHEIAGGKRGLCL